MANLSSEQVLAVTSVQQLIHDWAHELDVNNGAHIANLLTEDCAYTLRGTVQRGRAATVKHYKERLESFASESDGPPVHRHILSNLRVSFRTSSEVSITFNLVYFTTAGVPSGVKPADPVAVADVRMDCQRGADGDWKISSFDSDQMFQRVSK